MEAVYEDSSSSVSLSGIASILFRRGWIVVLFVGVSLWAANYVSEHTPKQWRAVADMILIQRSATVSGSTQAAYAAPMIETPETQLAMLQSYALAARTVDVLKNQALARGKSPDTIGATVEDVKKAVQVSVPKDTNFLEVAVETDGKARAEELANAVCTAFVQWKKEQSQGDIEEALGSLQVRADRARAQMVEAESRETEFKKNRQLVDVSSQQKVALEQYLSRDAEAASVKQDLDSQQARLNALGERLKSVNEDIRSGTGVRDDALVLSLQNQLNGLEIDRAAAALKYTADYPNVLPDLDARIKDVKERLVKAVQGTIDNHKPSLQSQGDLFEQYKQAQVGVIFTKAKLAATSNLRDRLKAQTASLPQTSMEYARLARSSELARGLYTSLQAALSSARLDRDMASGNVQVAQHAFAPDEPVRPNRIRDLSFGAAIGLFLSLVGILMVEQSDTRLRDVSSVRRLAPGPVIGALPKLPRADARAAIASGSDSKAIEAMAITRANLSLLVSPSGELAAARGRVIMVTSTLPGEGKSLIAAHLARSIALSGRHTILVDGDMRRPSQNKLFGTAEPHGLADVLEGRIDTSEALVSTDVAHLSILHCGEADRSPTDLISTQQMAQVVDRLRSEANVVVIDTPACAVVADSLLMAPHADCIVVVVGAGQVDADDLRTTAASLSSAGPDHMAFVVNRAPRDRGSVYGRYNSYYRYSSPSGFRSRRRQSDDSDVPGREGRPGGAGEALVKVVDSASETGIAVVDTDPGPTGARIVGVEGKLAGESFELLRGSFSIGRSAENHLVIVGDNSVSRHHATIVEQRGKYILCDQDSTNGTFVEGTPVRVHILAQGETFQIGGQRFRYEAGRTNGDKPHSASEA